MSSLKTDVAPSNSIGHPVGASKPKKPKRFRAPPIPLTSRQWLLTALWGATVFEYICDRLNVEPVNDSEKREEVQAELDSRAFHAYNLSREQIELILDDLHLVQNARRITEEYMVLYLKNTLSWKKLLSYRRNVTWNGLSTI